MALKSVAPVLVVLGMLSMSCASTTTPTTATADEAKRFLDDVNATMLKLGIEQGQAGWIAETYITADSEALNARATPAYIDAVRATPRRRRGSIASTSLPSFAAS